MSTHAITAAQGLVNSTRARELMQREHLDGLIAATPSNVTYACGFLSPSPHVFKTMQVLALLPRNELETVLIVPRGQLTYVAFSPPATKDIRAYGDATLYCPDGRDFGALEGDVLKAMRGSPKFSDPAQALASAIADRGLEKARLGIDELGVLPEWEEAFKRLLPRVEFANASRIWELIRAVKTPAEVEHLKRAARVNEEALGAALGAIMEGATSYDLSEAYRTAACHRGAVPRFWLTRLGATSALFAPPDQQYRGKTGDVVFLDGALTYGFYWADTGRTAVLSTASDKQKTYYSALHQGMSAGLNLVRPGTPADKIFHTIVSAVRASGIPHYTRPACGHGVGLDFYESPPIRPNSTQDGKDKRAEPVLLEEGMVVNLETPYYELGFGGLQIEDTVLVTSQGYEFLTTRTRELLSL